MARLTYLSYMVLAALVFLSVPARSGEEPLEDLVRTDSIDCIMGTAVATGLINGGTVLIGSSDGDLFVGAYGSVDGTAGAQPVRLDTVFDLASLTKVVATTPSIMKLVDDGKVNLLDPVTKWFPEFVGTGKDDLLVLNLLTHTSGFDDFPAGSCVTVQELVDLAATRDLKAPPGGRFRYADINFILLGELVRRVSGTDLTVYARENIFLPLGMEDTTFKPGAGLRARCAATVGESDVLQYGTVQDPVARRLGGAAGHAGLFGTAADLSRFCRMILKGGEAGGGRILSQEALRQMTTPFAFHEGKVVRAVGWDMVSPFSSPKGNGFSGASFGHTGYTGCSVWIDPASDLYVIILASRREHRRNVEFNRLRSSVSTLAASLFSHPGNRGQCRENRGGSPRQKT